MKVYNTDRLHLKINKNILLAESYTEIKELSFIIKSCRLKPYDYLFKNKKGNFILHNHWVDEFGNSLFIYNNKKIIFTFNDLSIDRNKITCTDLYYGLTISKILKISKLLFIYYGKDEDLNNEFAILAFLGIDNYLRCFMHLYDKWEQISPLYLGINNLKKIYSNLDIRYFLNIKNIKNSLTPCMNGQTWVSCLPMSSDFVSILNKETNIILPKLLERN